MTQMTEEQRQRLEGMSRIGKKISCKDKLQPGSQWEPGIVVDEVYIMVTGYKHMIQKIELSPGESWDGSRFAYRTGYYTYDKDMKKITWGQNTQFLTEKEYRELLKKAKEKNWDIFC